MMAFIEVRKAADQEPQFIEVDSNGVMRLEDGTALTLAVLSDGTLTMAAIEDPVVVAQPTRGNLQANVTLQLAGVDVAAENPVPVEDTWEIALVSDEVGNNSNKALYVPAGYKYQILWIWVEYASNAIGGNRQLQIDVRDGAADVIGQLRAGTTQAASIARYYMFAPALADLTGFRDTDYLMTPLPPTLFLPAGYSLRVFDNNTIAVGGDDMNIQMQVARRAV